MNTYTQITYEQRCQIYTLKDTGCRQQSMADTVGVSQSAISRELKRNTGNRGHRYEQAQSKASERRLKAVKAFKMNSAMTALIESRIREHLSPEQVSGRLRMEENMHISTETIYRMILKDKAAGGRSICIYAIKARNIVNAMASTTIAVLSLIVLILLTDRVWWIVARG